MWDKLVAVAEALLKYETLTGDDVHRIMRGEVLDKPTIGELLAKEAAQSQEPKVEPTIPDEPRIGDEPDGILPSPA